MSFSIDHREVFRFRFVVYARYQSYRGKERDHRRASVREEGQRDADNGGDADAHADVDEGLERKRARDAEAD